MPENSSSFNSHKVLAAVGLILTISILIVAGIWLWVESQDKTSDVLEEEPVKISTSSAKPATGSTDVKN